MSRCIHAHGAILNVSCGPDFDIVVDGVKFHFEFDHRWGPLFVGKRGQEIKQPGVRHKVWRAVDLWKRQGMRSEGGICIWDWKSEFSELTEGFVQIGKRTWVSESIAKKVSIETSAAIS